MKEQEIILQLNKLKSVEPRESWVLNLRNDILPKAPFCVEAEQNIGLLSIFNVFSRSLSAGRIGYGLAAFLVMTSASGFMVVSMAKSSLPGDAFYSVKMANENIVLAVSSEEDKPKKELEFAGKRLEELTEISKNSSAIDQQNKVQELVGKYQEKVENVNKYMASVNSDGKKDKLVKIAKFVNVQSEKYTDVLSKAKENLPVAVQEKVSAQVDSAINKSENINTSSLMVLVEAKGGLDSSISNEEIALKIQRKIDRIEMNLNNDSKDIKIDAGQKSGDSKNENTSDSKAVDKKLAANEENNDNVANSIGNEDGSVKNYSKKELIQMANENIKNNNLLDAVKNVATLQEIGISGDNKDAVANIEEKKDGAVLPVDSGIVDGVSDTNKDEVENSQVQPQKIEPVAVDGVEDQSLLNSNEKVETLKP